MGAEYYPCWEGEDSDFEMAETFSYEMMRTITDNFSQDRLLVTGNKWEVYRGTLLDKELTVKVCRYPHAEEIVHSEDERRILDSQLRIIGHCFQPPELVGVVFDVVPLATLHSKLSDEKFSWSLRLKAALDIARTISFLHDQDPCYVLRNLEASHILLDANFKPFLCDLGFGGTLAYQHMFRSKEFKRLHIGHSGTSLTADDVFDFGSIVLALLAMRPVLDAGQHVVEWVNSLSKDKRERRICHPRLMCDGFVFSDAYSISAVALQCVGRSAKRPSMKKVVASLEDIMYLKISNWRDRGMRHTCCAYEGSLSLKTVTDIEELTGCLSTDNLLGELVFILKCCHISLYRGEMKQDSDSGARKEVTVKICDEPRLGAGHFEDEMMFLTHECMTRHPNLAKLIGYCRDKKMCAIIYDVASLSTLQDKLADTEYGWTQRIQAALGIASAVAYLHSQKPPCVLHNLNPANIVLDKEWEPILVDYGLLTGGISGKEEFRFADYFGSLGYLDKSGCGDGTEGDVYSFGVILMALVLGRLAYDPTNPMKDLVQWADSKKMGIVPPQLTRCMGYVEDDAQEMLKLARLCVSPDHKLRPRMKKVVGVLKSLKFHL